MAKLQAKKIAEALKKAQQVGEVEEAFTIANCAVVLRSLRPDEYEASLGAIGELEDLAYIHAYKVEHLCRSLIELNGESMRDYEFVEVDVEEMDNTTGKSVVRSVTLERNQFVKDYIIGTWSREAIDVAFRKFNDVVAKAERTASDNVKFEVPEETEDDKYRRLLGEAKAIEPTIPLDLAARIRDEFGYILKQEWTAAEEKLSQVEEPKTPAPQAQVESAPPPAPSAPAPVLQPPSTSAFLRPAREAPPAPASTPAPVFQPPIITDPAVLRKAAELQQLEGAPGVLGEEIGTSPRTAYNPHADPPQPRPQARNPEEAKTILDQPPTGGINSRFRPPTRL